MTDITISYRLHNSSIINCIVGQCLLVYLKNIWADHHNKMFTNNTSLKENCLTSDKTVSTLISKNANTKHNEQCSTKHTTRRTDTNYCTNELTTVLHHDRHFRNATLAGLNWRNWLTFSCDVATSNTFLADAGRGEGGNVDRIGATRTVS